MMDCHFTEAPLSSAHFVQWIVNLQFFFLLRISN
jgi:hypothetical protein